jgi:hypothetical protein
VEPNIDSETIKGGWAKKHPLFLGVIEAFASKKLKAVTSLLFASFYYGAGREKSCTPA